MTPDRQRRDNSAGLAWVSPALFADIWCVRQAVWVRPVGISMASALADRLADDQWLRLAGGAYGFTHLDLVIRNAPSGYCAARFSLTEAHVLTGGMIDDQLAALTAPRPAFAGLAMDRVHVMGIVNVTPDSFSDGGRFASAELAIAHGRVLAAAGASILDIGGESTRPGAAPLTPADELARITPVITALAADGHIVSADTRHTAVMGPALAAGAKLINDVSGFTAPGAAELMGQAYTGRPEAPFAPDHPFAPNYPFAIAMHMKGEPQTMQANPTYSFAPIEVFEALRSHIDRLVAAGLPRANIAVDPGFGFGKTPSHNADIIRWTGLFHGLGVPVLIGVSRKSSIPKLATRGGQAGTYGTSPDDRLGGSLALTLTATAQGTQIIRTHDIAETVQAVAVQRGVG